MNSLANRVVVIVGGSSGIGKKCALLFAQHGTDTLLIARGSERLREVCDEIRTRGGRAQEFVADVTSREQIKQIAGQIMNQYGYVDVLIYGAGVFYLSPVESMNIDTAKHAMEVNYWGAVNVIQAFLPLIRNGQHKSIVLLSSLSVPCTPPFFAAYAVTKHALRGLALSLRQELRPEGIRVQMVLPGPVDTPLIENHLHGDMYRLPPGIPVLDASTTAKQILRAVLRRAEDTVIPQRLSWAARFAYAFPSLVESYYRFSVPSWLKVIQSQVETQRRDSFESHHTLVQTEPMTTSSELEE